MTDPGVPHGKIVAAYRMHHSSRVVASLLAIPVPHVIRVLRGYSQGLLLPRGGAYQHIHKHPGKLHSSFAAWVRAHPGYRFPRDLNAIARLTGCSKNAIKCFLYRQRKLGRAVPLLRKCRRKTTEGPSGSAPASKT